MKNIFSILLITFLLSGCSSIKTVSTTSVVEKESETPPISTSISLNRSPNVYSSIEKVKEAKKNKNSEFLENKKNIFVLINDVVAAQGSYKIGEYAVFVDYQLGDDKSLNFTQQEFEDIDYAFKDTISRSLGENIVLNNQPVNVYRHPEATIVIFTKDKYLCKFIISKDITDKEIEKLIKSVNKIDLNN